jgi:hypothetical protein
MISRTTPSRVVNIVENIAIPFQVTRTQELIDHYQGTNELTRQTEKALKEWHDAAEYDLLHSTLVSGVSGVAPKMEGILAHISTSSNYTAQNSGTVWSASILKGQMKNNWDVSNGDVATDIYMGSFLKDVTDDFTNKTNVVNQGSVGINQIVTVVDYFETGFGRVAVHKHRIISLSSDASARVLGLRIDKCKIAFLENPRIDTGLARSGDYTPRAVVGKLTFECRNKKASWHAYGYDKD